MTVSVTPSPASLPVPRSGGEPAPDLAAGQQTGEPLARLVGPAGMLTAVQVCDRPCGPCPWRRDNADRAGYDNLPDYAAGTIPGEPDFGRPDPGDPYAPLGVLFGCHRHTADARLCAGHLAVVGHAHPLVRLGISIGLIDPAVLMPGDDWPALYDSYAQMLTATGHTPPPDPAPAQHDHHGDH